MELSVRIERWPIAGAFAISRGRKTEAVVVVAELDDGTHRGRGESVPYARYGETPDAIVAKIEALRPALRQGLDRQALQTVLGAGAARNALDCAYWDVNARRAGRRAYELAGLAAPKALTTAYTISLASPSEMAAAAEVAAWRPLLKIKLGGGDDEMVPLFRLELEEVAIVPGLEASLERAGDSDDRALVRRVVGLLFHLLLRVAGQQRHR